MNKLLLAVAATWAIMMLVPLPVYGTLSLITGIEPPTTGSPARFMASVAVVKIGVAIAFVWLYALARESWAGRWTTYALVWWVMFAIMEVGQAIVPEYSWLDAGGGIIAEAIYCPLAAVVISRLLGTPRPAAIKPDAMREGPR